MPHLAQRNGVTRRGLADGRASLAAQLGRGIAAAGRRRVDGGSEDRSVMGHGMGMARAWHGMGAGAGDVKLRARAWINHKRPSAT